MQLQRTQTTAVSLLREVMVKSGVFKLKHLHEWFSQVSPVWAPWNESPATGAARLCLCRHLLTADILFGTFLELTFLARVTRGAGSASCESRTADTPKNKHYGSAQSHCQSVSLPIHVTANPFTTHAHADEQAGTIPFDNTE